MNLPKYTSYKPDPYACFIDAFSVYWGFYNCYLLPLFSLIRQTSQRICMDQREIVFAVPKWPTQPWCNSFEGMFFQEPYVVTAHKENLLLPQKQDTWLNGLNLWNKVSPLELPVHFALVFLSSLVRQQKSFNQLCMVRSTLTSLINQQQNVRLSNIRIVKRYMIVIFEKKPTLPKFWFIWNVSLLEFLSAMCRKPND